MEGNAYFCTAFEKRRALSSVGSERLPYKQRVGGSNPSVPTSFSRIAILPRATQGHLAQLVQSVCLTSRGSGVRIPQCPLPFPQVARRSSERMNIFPERALSSVGSERLPYKQRVGGSNPSVPTKKKEGVLNDFNAPSFCKFAPSFCVIEVLLGDELVQGNW